MVLFFFKCDMVQHLMLFCENFTVKSITWKCETKFSHYNVILSPVFFQCGSKLQNRIKSSWLNSNPEQDGDFWAATNFILSFFRPFLLTVPSQLNAPPKRSVIAGPLSLPPASVFAGWRLVFPSSRQPWWFLLWCDFSIQPPSSSLPFTPAAVVQSVRSAPLTSLGSAIEHVFQVQHDE